MSRTPFTTSSVDADPVFRMVTSVAALPVLADDVGLGREAVAHVGHVAEVDRRVADHLDREVVQLGAPSAGCAFIADVVLELADLGRPGGQHDVLLARAR